MDFNEDLARILLGIQWGVNGNCSTTSEKIQKNDPRMVIESSCLIPLRSPLFGV